MKSKLIQSRSRVLKLLDSGLITTKEYRIFVELEARLTRDIDKLLKEDGLLT